MLHTKAQLYWPFDFRGEKYWKSFYLNTDMVAILVDQLAIFVNKLSFPHLNDSPYEI